MIGLVPSEEQHIGDIEEDEEVMSDSSNPDQVAKRRRLAMFPAPSVSYEPSLANDEAPIPPDDVAVPHGLNHANHGEPPHDVPELDAIDNLDYM